MRVYELRIVRLSDGKYSLFESNEVDRDCQQDDGYETPWPALAELVLRVPELVPAPAPAEGG